MRPGDAHVEGDFTGGVVGDGARIVMVRPISRVVVVALQGKNFVFGFDIAVLGNAEVNADAAFIDCLPVESGILYGFVGRINADAAGPGAAAKIFFRLVAECVEVADAGERLADIANFVVGDTAFSSEQGGAEFGQVIAVGRSQADAGD